MTQEEKSILLKDLCARLPYGIIGSQVLNNKIWGLPELLLNIDIQEEKVECSDSLPYDLENFRPYLRPMSFMTEDEYNELKKIGDYYGFAPFKYIDDWCPNYDMTDWLDKNMFDYRGLIEKGLAIAVTKDNNPYKE